MSWKLKAYIISTNLFWETFLIWAVSHAQPHGFCYWLGLLLAVAATPFFIWTRVSMFGYVTLLPRARGLVISGPYKRIRHPMYVFSTINLLGLGIALNRGWYYAALAALIPLQVWRAHKEEQVMLRHYGHAYWEYMRRTWI